MANSRAKKVQEEHGGPIRSENKEVVKNDRTHQKGTGGSSKFFSVKTKTSTEMRNSHRL
jgi:hypothetical protein